MHRLVQHMMNILGPVPDAKNDTETENYPPRTKVGEVTLEIIRCTHYHSRFHTKTGSNYGTYIWFLFIDRSARHWAGVLIKGFDLILTSTDKPLILGIIYIWKVMENIIPLQMIYFSYKRKRRLAH